MTNTGSTLDIKHLLVQTLDLRGYSAEDIADDEPLFGGRLGLDSLDALELAVALEQRFGVAIPEGDESRKIFESVASIARYVATSAKVRR
ncbi:MAG TPA: phosphopantetheine-binding protein [Polyangiaceae bacterium]